MGQQKLKLYIDVMIIKHTAAGTESANHFTLDISKYICYQIQQLLNAISVQRLPSCIINDKLTLFPVKMVSHQQASNQYLSQMNRTKAALMLVIS